MYQTLERASLGTAALPKLATYVLEDLADTIARAEAHRPAASSARAAPAEKKAKYFVSGDDELRIDLDSGTERLWRKSLFHKSPGVEKPLEDSFFVSKARAHVEAAGLAKVDALEIFYNYKVRRYKNGEIPAGSGFSPTVTTYQVAIAFNTMIDDVPIVGPGGKIAVHMTTDGTVAFHESTMRYVKNKVVSHTLDTLVTPAEAEKTAAAKMAARGISLIGYKVTRKEFGYLRNARNVFQTVLAPAYLYTWEPLDLNRTDAKKYAELVQAAKDSTTLTLLAADEAANKLRTAKLFAPNKESEHH